MLDLAATDVKAQAIELAQQFKMDAHDIQEAYKSKPESLVAHFNAVSEAKEDRGWYIGLGIFWGLVCFPVAFYPAWKLAEKYTSLNSVEKTLRDEVQTHKVTGGKCCAPKPDNV